MDNQLQGPWLSGRWDAQAAPYTAINHILRMYYNSANASDATGEDQVYDASLTKFEIDHFIGIQFVAGYIAKAYDFRQISTGQLELLSQHLNHPCNLYKVNQAFNQNIGHLPLEAYSNSPDRDYSITKYLSCKVARKHINKDEAMTDGIVYDGTVESNVQYLLDRMQQATGTHCALTVNIGAVFSQYLSLGQFRLAPTAQEKTNMGGFIQKGLPS